MGILKIKVGGQFVPIAAGAPGPPGPQGPVGVANVSRLVDTGSGYPPRPEGAVYVEWVGTTVPTEPTNSIADGDTWVKPA